MSRPILEVVDLEKHFGGVHVANSINYAMEEGEQSAIIGPNGAGKSTFMNLMTGYHRPDGGKVVFDGSEITGLPPHKVVRRGISRAFQVSSIFAHMTVGENVRAAVQAQMRATFRVFASARRLGAAETDRVLELCGLEGKRNLAAGALAQGDKKRLELAIALAGKPRLLFLDEPTAGMSIEEARTTMELVDRLNRELKLTVLFTEHDMGIVFNHARRLTLLHRGQIILDGSPEEVRANETAQRVYLGEKHA